MNRISELESLVEKVLCEYQEWFEKSEAIASLERMIAQLKDNINSDIDLVVYHSLDVINRMRDGWLFGLYRDLFAPRYVWVDGHRERQTKPLHDFYVGCQVIAQSRNREEGEKNVKDFSKQVMDGFSKFIEALENELAIAKEMNGGEQ